MKNSFVNGNPRAELISKIIGAVVLMLGVGFILFYIFLPPINLQDMGFWLYLTVVIASGTLPFLDIHPERLAQPQRKGKAANGNVNLLDAVGNKLMLIPIAIPLAILVLGSMFSSEVFNARG